MPVRVYFPAVLAVVCGVGVVCAGAAPAAAGPARVAVADFESSGAANPEFEALGRGLQSMVTTDLSQVKSISLVERARLKDVLAELALHQTALVDKETAARIGKLSGATHLMVGTVVVVQDQMRIDSRVFSVQSGAVVLAETAQGNKARFFELEKSLVKKLIASTGTRLAAREDKELSRPATTSYDAFRSYGRGLALGDEKRYPEAIAAMREARQIDPGFALAAEAQQGYEAQLAATPRAALPLPVPTSAPGGGGLCCCPNPAGAACNGIPVPRPPSGPGAPPGMGSSSSPQLVTTSLSAPGDQHLTVIAGEGESPARCITPCQLDLPAGRTRLTVVGPSQTYSQPVDLPAGPVTLTTDSVNRNNYIIGGSLGGAGLALLVLGAYMSKQDATIYNLGDMTTTGPQPNPWGPTFAFMPFSIGVGLLVPSVYYLLRGGQNKVTVHPISAPGPAAPAAASPPAPTAPTGVEAKP